MKQSLIHVHVCRIDSRGKIFDGAVDLSLACDLYEACRTVLNCGEYMGPIAIIIMSPRVKFR
jgi:hypothetical protein